LAARRVAAVRAVRVRMVRPLVDSLTSIDRHLLDPADELERQVIGEIDGRSDIHADVKPLAGRDLDWNGLGQLAFGDLGVVHPHGHGRALAESASAVAGKNDLGVAPCPSATALCWRTGSGPRRGNCRQTWACCRGRTRSRAEGDSRAAANKLRQHSSRSSSHCARGDH